MFRADKGEVLYNIVGTSTNTLNIFPSLGGAIMQKVSGLMADLLVPGVLPGLWLFMMIRMVIAQIESFLS